MKSTFIDNPEIIQQLLKVTQNKKPLRFLEGVTELMEAYNIGSSIYIFYRYDSCKEELPHLVEKVFQENEFAY